MTCSMSRLYLYCPLITVSCSCNSKSKGLSHWFMARHWRSAFMTHMTNGYSFFYPWVVGCNHDSWMLAMVFLSYPVGTWFSQLLCSGLMPHRWVIFNILNILTMALFMHCKNSIPKNRNKYSHKWNCAASVPIPTFMFLWAIYIFPRSVCLFCCRKIGIPIVGIYKSVRDTWMWKWDYSFLGVHKSDILCSVTHDLRLWLCLTAMVLSGTHDYSSRYPWLMTRNFLTQYRLCSNVRQDRLRCMGSPMYCTRPGPRIFHVVS